ncbi:glia maturation factor gamma [Silurus asotus]|uniref:Glia maturation factor gamma n=1 Tax=Silurus asotus TaxID=30991 RepID=A0AAD5FQC6_SILAS|nr:glia maturation factor gamma [Silurus asotus]
MSIHYSPVVTAQIRPQSCSVTSWISFLKRLRFLNAADEFASSLRTRPPYARYLMLVSSISCAINKEKSALGRTGSACTPRSNPHAISSSLVVCEVDPSLTEKLKKFRFRKETTNGAILMKIDMEKQLVILEEEYEDISLDDLKEELPERQPRYPYHYKLTHSDGRVSYPLCFIFCSPVGCKPEQQMMYAGSKNRLVQTAELTKVFETRNTDDLSEEWLKEKLSFFR